MKYTLSYSGGQSGSKIKLNGSKSISNRVLIIQALCGEAFSITNLSNAKDTTTLNLLLASIADDTLLDTGAAGTTFRFLTAYLAFQHGSQTLTGSPRMKERPIGVLVDALRKLGADITYLEKEGFPPLQIKNAKYNGVKEVQLPADVSSQYISALMLIGPYLQNGLKIKLIGEIVSLPYLMMTKNLISFFGGDIDFETDTFTLRPSKYTAQPFQVEGDWSAASYYYAIVAFEKIGFQIKLDGIHKDSLQGDHVMMDIGNHFGVETSFDNGIATLTKKQKVVIESFKYDFLLCPDIAQTVSVMMAGLDVQGELTGLKTLRIKETDRINALRVELAKVLVKVNDHGQEDCFIQEGKSNISENICFDTYEDHRMAMALASLAIYGTIQISEPNVVNKSYPEFWNDLKSLGFNIR